MSTLALVTALAAQATAPSGSTAPSTDVPANDRGTNPGVSTYIDLEAGAGYSTNPVQRISGSTGAAYGRFSITGVHSRVSARTTTSISALAQDTVYTRRDGSQLSADLRASHTARVSERFSVFGSVEGSVDKGGQLDTRILVNPIVPVVPGVVQPPIVLLPGGDILSVTGRQYRILVNAGGQLALGTRDSLSFSSGIQHVVSKNGVFDTRYTTIPLSIGYNRTLSTRTTAGAEVDYAHTDYNGPASFQTISPRLTLRQALSERMSLSGSVGPSFSSSDDGMTTRHSTGVAGDVNLCSSTERTQFCGRVSLSQQVATSIGASRSISAGLSYSRRLDANQTLRFTVDANRYSTPTLLVTGPSFSHATYVRAAADYSRRFGGRWYGGATLAARKFTQTGPDPKADVSGSLFIRYRLGDIR